MPFDLHINKPTAHDEEPSGGQRTGSGSREGRAGAAAYSRAGGMATRANGAGAHAPAQRRASPHALRGETGCRGAGRSRVLFADVPMRKLHDSIRNRFSEFAALGEHHSPTGRIAVLNHNWETLVRRGRGYRNHDYLLRRLRFMTANPIRHSDGVRGLLALGIPAPTRAAA